jgi:hypothetical protein
MAQLFRDCVFDIKSPAIGADLLRSLIADLRGPLFKCMPAKYVDAFLNQGRGQLGTLLTYANKEAAGPSRHDASESTTADLICQAQTSGASSPIPIELGERNVVTVLNTSVSTSSQNCLLYCLSKRPSEAQLQHYSNEKGESHVCVMIKQPAVFLGRLDDFVRRSVGAVRGSAFSPCVYRPRRLRLSTGHALEPPAFVKDTRYMFETEARAVWSIDGVVDGYHRFELSDLNDICEALTPARLRDLDQRSHVLLRARDRTGVLRHVCVTSRGASWWGPIDRPM